MDAGMEMIDSYADLYSVGLMFSSTEGVGTAILATLGAIVGIIVMVVLAVFTFVMHVISLPFRLIGSLFGWMFGGRSSSSSDFDQYQAQAQANFDQYRAQAHANFEEASNRMQAEHDEAVRRMGEEHEAWKKSHGFTNKFLQRFSQEGFSLEAAEAIKEKVSKVVKAVHPTVCDKFGKVIDHWFDVIHDLTGEVGGHILDVSKQVKSDEYPLKDEYETLIGKCKSTKSALDGYMKANEFSCELKDVKINSMKEAYALVGSYKKGLEALNKRNAKLEKCKKQFADQMKKAKELNKFKAVGAKVKTLAAECRSAGMAIAPIAKDWNKAITQSLKNVSAVLPKKGKAGK